MRTDSTLKKDDLNILTINVHSLVNKFDVFVGFINQFKHLDVIVVTESWFKDRHWTSSCFPFNIPGYIPIVQNRSGETNGGGICIYVKSRLSHTTVISFESSECQLVIIELLQLKIKVGAVYRTPNTDFEAFLDTLDEFLEKFPKCIWLGDININLMEKNRNDSNRINKYRTVLVSNNFELLNKISGEYSTYFHSRSGHSILDHVFYDMPEYDVDIHVKTAGFTDHNAVIACLKIHEQVPPAINLWKRVDYRALKSRLAPAVERSSTLDETVNSIKIELQACTRTVRVSEGGLSWMNNPIREAMNERDYFKRQHVRHPANIYFDRRYKELRNKVTGMVRQAKRKQLHEDIEKCSGDARKTWRIINESVLGRPSKNKESITELVTDQGERVTDGQAINDLVAEYFCNVGVNLKANLPRPSSDPMTNVKRNSVSMLLKPVTQSTVRKILKEMRVACAAGPDKITVRVIKDNLSLFTRKFTKFINESFESGTFPSSLKVSRGVILYKNGDKRRIKNYRSISIPSVFSKVWEKALLIQMTEFLNTSGYLNKRQYGFLQKMSTTAAATDFVSRIQEALNKSHPAGAILIDVAKAFDCIDHELLLKKLEASGFGGPALALLRNYLEGRTLITEIGGKCSRPMPVKCGVPQGSILSPLLFTIFVNDALELPLSGTLQMFADDSAYIYSCADLHVLQDVMNADLNQIYEWFTNNFLTMNIDKTHYMIFTTRKTAFPQSLQPITLNGKDLSRIDSCKYLGLHLDNHLSWEQHVNAVAASTAPYVGILGRMKHIADEKTKKLIYYAHIHSKFLYMNHIWCTAAKSQIKRLEVLQNKAVRRVMHRSYSTLNLRTLDLYNMLNLLPLSKLGEYNTAMEAYKILNGLTTSNVIKFQRGDEVHTYNTRNREHIRLPQPRNNHGLKQIEYRGGAILNSLPPEVKNAVSLGVFKSGLKKALMR